MFLPALKICTKSYWRKDFGILQNKKQHQKNWLSNNHNACNHSVRNVYNKSNKNDNNDINKNVYDMIMMMIIWLILITATNCSNDMVMMTTNAMMMVKRMMVIIMTKVHFCLVSSDTCFLGVWHNYLTEMGLWVQHNFYFWESCSKRKVSSRPKY